MNKKRLRQSCAGTTLIELIVTFALIAVFMAAATVMATAALQVFGRIKQTGYAQSTCDVILDRIEGELSTANSSNLSINAAGTLSTDSGDITLPENGSICCQDGKGAKVCIFATPYETQTQTGGRLVVHYYSDGIQASTDWTYDNIALMGYRIETLSFSKQREDTVRADVTVVSVRTGYQYSAYRVIPCYYLKYDAAYSVVDSGTIWPESGT